MKRLGTFLPIFALTIALASPAAAQWAVTDPATTARNAITAALKDRLLQTLTAERDRLQRMAARLSSVTSLAKYVIHEVPRWRIHDFESDAFLFSRGYHSALNYGDATGAEYLRVVRARQPEAARILAALPPEARDTVVRALGTLDAADSAMIAGTHQTGSLRFNGRRELDAIDALERDVVDPSSEQSTTAVLDKISGAALVETRQTQARIQLIAAMTEQLLLDNKRSRDGEAATMNMLLGRLRDGRQASEAVTSGTADDLRTWRQP